MNTKELIERLRDEADLCRAETADDVARLLGEAADTIARLEAERDAAVAELDYIASNARCDPKMDGQHVWWPTSFNHRLTGPSLRAAIRAAMEKP